MDLALLVVRLVVGMLLAGHGAQKLFGWFEGGRLAQTAGWLGSLGFRPARMWALLAANVEFFGGVLFTLGLFSPLGSIGIGSSMLMAITRVHWPKVWASKGGFELPLTNLAVVIAVGLIGPGAYALDTSLGTALPGTLTLIVIFAALVFWVIGLMMTGQKAQAPTPAVH